MRVLILYKNDTDYTRTVTDFLYDLKKQTGYELEELDPDTAEGADICRIYDIVEYPTIIALSEDGALQNLWRGLPLPLISEVSYYASLE